MPAAGLWNGRRSLFDDYQNVFFRTARMSCTDNQVAAWASAERRSKLTPKTFRVILGHKILAKGFRPLMRITIGRFTAGGLGCSAQLTNAKSDTF